MRYNWEREPYPWERHPTGWMIAAAISISLFAGYLMAG